MLVDTNVWIDCIDSVSPWHDWAVQQLQLRSERSPSHVNVLVYAELLVPGPDVQALDELLDVFDVQRGALPWACAGLAASALANYKRRGGKRQPPLPDFFTGAHAAIANLSVLTRDRAGYASYFPRLALFGP